MIVMTCQICQETLMTRETEPAKAFVECHLETCIEPETHSDD